MCGLNLLRREGLGGRLSDRKDGGGAVVVWRGAEEEEEEEEGEGLVEGLVCGGGAGELSLLPPSPK